jgi:hypothetical protein
MTSEELATICSSFVSELNRDPSFCIPNLFPGSGGSFGRSSYAIEPRPGVILVVDPRHWNCGFGIHVVPGSSCPRRHRNNPGLALDQPTPAQVEPPIRAGAKRMGGLNPGPIARCLLANATLREANEAEKYLGGLKRQLGAKDDELPDGHAHNDLMVKTWDWSQSAFSKEVWESVFGNVSAMTLWVTVHTDRELIRALELAWRRAVKEAKEDLGSHHCRNVARP